MTIRGLDNYGRIDGSAIRQAGYSFICRYLNDGPPRQLTLDEANDLHANGIAIVSNWEHYVDDATKGYSQGVQDANDAVAATVAAGAPSDNPIYFSLDIDLIPGDPRIDAVVQYLDGAGSVIGAHNVGIYAGVPVITAALNAGKAAWSWRAKANSWSHGQTDGRINLYQQVDTVTVGGIDGVDVDEASSPNYGQWGSGTGTGGGLNPSAINNFKTAFMGPIGSDVKDVREQLCGAGSRDQGQYTGWSQLGGRSVVDALAAIASARGVPPRH